MRERKKEKRSWFDPRGNRRPGGEFPHLARDTPLSGRESARAGRVPLPRGRAGAAAGPRRRCAGREFRYGRAGRIGTMVGVRAPGLFPR